jgi:hypothetical protein
MRPVALISAFRPQCQCFLVTRHIQFGRRYDEAGRPKYFPRCIECLTEGREIPVSWLFDNDVREEDIPDGWED